VAFVSMSWLGSDLNEEGYTHELLRVGTRIHAITMPDADSVYSPQPQLGAFFKFRGGRNGMGQQ
jgi:hypothetical protein